MSAHQHYDIEAITKNLIDATNSAMRSALSRAAPEDHAGIHAQNRLNLASNGMNIVCLQLVNEGVDPDVIAAASGAVIAILVSNAIRRFNSMGCEEIFLRNFENAMLQMALSNGTSSAGITVETVSVAPMAGGRA